jgi:hypothetical protein
MVRNEIFIKKNQKCRGKTQLTALLDGKTREVGL